MLLYVRSLTLPFVVAILSFTLSACSSAPVKKEPVADQTHLPTESTPGEAQTDLQIDLLGLQRSLKMSRPDDHLGYQEKAFNTCEAGYGFSSTHDCQNKYLAVVHFRLQCRDSEGTVSTASHVLTPIHSSSVKWSIANTTGRTSTDGDGYGKIVTLLPKSSRTERIRITANAKFLIQRASDLGRLVVPKDWCE